MATDFISVFQEQNPFHCNFLYIPGKTSWFLLWYWIQDCSKYVQCVFYFMLFWCCTLTYLHFHMLAQLLQYLLFGFLLQTNLYNGWMFSHTSTGSLQVKTFIQKKKHQQQKQRWKQFKLIVVRTLFLAQLIPSVNFSKHILCGVLFYCLSDWLPAKVTPITTVVKYKMYYCFVCYPFVKPLVR